MWLNSLKIALAAKNLEAIEKLIDEMPQFEDVEDARKASFLLQEALNLFTSLKNEASSSMKQIKSNIKVLNSTKDSGSGLDIKL